MLYAVILLAAASVSQGIDRTDDRKAILNAIAAIHPQHVGTWNEVSPPFREVKAIRFVSPTEALVAVEEKRFGSVIVMQTSPMVLRMKKEGGKWRRQAYGRVQ